MHMRRIWLPVLALGLAACQAEKGHIPGGEFDPTVRTRDPGVLVSLLVSTTTPEASRKSADALLVELKGKEDPTRLGVLEQMLYAPGHSDAMRIYALDQLADAGRLGRPLVLHLPRMEGAVLAHACELAVKEGNEAAVDPLVRSMERGLADGGDLKARPEWRAIEQLGGRAVEETLYNRLAGATDRSVRTAALDLLPSVQPPEQVKERLKAMGGGDTWLSDLQWWVRSFDGLPFGENETSWVGFLHRPEQAPLVARALERHGRLRSGGGAPDYVAAPRFVHTLAYIDDETLGLSREALLAQIGTRLSAMPHVRRQPEYAGAADDVEDRLEAQAARLSRGDLLAIILLLRALEDGGNLSELHRLGLADLADTTTEHGGLLAFINIQRPTLTIRPFAPLYANNNFEYVASDRLLLETPNAVAQYHFHYQQIRNAERAGPGSGDMAYARRARCTCVVITSTNTREFNVDYYTPTGAVVDLGTYRVPNP
jgi:hypothetical protein